MLAELCLLGTIVGNLGTLAFRMVGWQLKFDTSYSTSAGLRFFHLNLSQNHKQSRLSPTHLLILHNRHPTTSAFS